MIETGPVRKRFEGDSVLAMRYMHRGRVLLGMLKEDMKFGNMPVGFRTYTFPVDEVIEADALIAHELIESGDSTTEIKTTRQYRLRGGHVVIQVSSLHGQDEILIDTRRVESLEDLKKATDTKKGGGYLRVRILMVERGAFGFQAMDLIAVEPNETQPFITGVPLGADPQSGISSDQVYLGTYSTPGLEDINRTPLAAAKAIPAGEGYAFARISKNGMYGDLSASNAWEASGDDIDGSNRFIDNIMSVSFDQDTYEHLQLAVVDSEESANVWDGGEGTDPGPRIGTILPGEYVFKTVMGGFMDDGFEVSGEIEITCGTPSIRRVFPFDCGPRDSEAEDSGDYSNQYFLVNAAAGTVKVVGGSTLDLGIQQ